MSVADAAVVQRVRQGDQKAFAMLVSRYEGPLYNLACRMVHDADDAADIVQNTFVKVYLKLDTFDRSREFFSWLYRIAVNECLDHLSRRRRHCGFHADRATVARTPEDEYRTTEAGDALRTALCALSFDHRVVIVLKHLLQLSYDDIAGILDLPQQTVKSRLFAARQGLRKQLVEQGYVG